MSSASPSPLVRTLRIHSPSVVVAIGLCLTLGLAPFHPEPHIIKQLRNVLHGQLREVIDVFDLVIHGFPFLVLFLVVVRIVREAQRQRTPSSTRMDSSNESKH